MFQHVSMCPDDVQRDDFPDSACMPVSKSHEHGAVTYLTMAGIQLCEESKAPVKAVLEPHPLFKFLRGQLLALGCRE